MQNKLRFEEAESRILQAFLVLAIIGSILCDTFGVDSKWQIPIIFISILAIFRIVSQLRDRQNSVRVEFYRSNSEFYSSVRHMIGRAQRRVLVSYIRLIPPPGFHSMEAEGYFKYGIEWARVNPDRELRRIIGVTRDPKMQEWIIRHYEDTKQVRNYLVRVVHHCGDVDGINMAIIDGEMVYLAISSDGQAMTGHGLRSPQAVESFTEYYYWWWNSAEPIDSYVARMQAN